MGLGFSILQIDFQNIFALNVTFIGHNKNYQERNPTEIIHMSLFLEKQTNKKQRKTKNQTQQTNKQNKSKNKPKSKIHKRQGGFIWPDKQQETTGFVKYHSNIQRGEAFHQRKKQSIC